MNLLEQSHTSEKYSQYVRRDPYQPHKHLKHLENTAGQLEGVGKRSTPSSMYQKKNPVPAIASAAGAYPNGPLRSLDVSSQRQRGNQVVHQPNDNAQQRQNQLE